MSQRTVVMAVAAFAAAVSAGAATPAFAQYGAIAFDPATRREGWTWNHNTPHSAERDALNYCASPGCRIILRIPPGTCGALATAVRGDAYGYADRRYRDQARLAALEYCQQRTSAQCAIRIVDCNR